jgi:hypothetical protein
MVMRNNESRVFRAFFYLSTILTALVFLFTISACSSGGDGGGGGGRKHAVNSVEWDYDLDGVPDRVDKFTLDSEGKILRIDEDWGADDVIDRFVVFEYNAEGNMTRETWTEVTVVSEIPVPPGVPDIYIPAPPDRIINYDVDGKTILTEEVDEDRDGNYELVGTYTPKPFDKPGEVQWARNGNPDDAVYTYSYKPEDKPIRIEFDTGNDEVIDSVAYYSYGTDTMDEYYDSDNSGMGVFDVEEIDQAGYYVYVPEGDFSAGDIEEFRLDADFDENHTDDLISYYSHTYDLGTDTKITTILEDWFPGDYFIENSRYWYYLYTGEYNEKREYIRLNYENPPTDEYLIHRYDNYGKLLRIDHYPDQFSIILLGIEYVTSYVDVSGDPEPERFEYYNVLTEQYVWAKDYTYDDVTGYLEIIEYDDNFDGNTDRSNEYTYYTTGLAAGYMEKNEYLDAFGNPTVQGTTNYQYGLNNDSFIVVNGKILPTVMWSDFNSDGTFQETNSITEYVYDDKGNIKSIKTDNEWPSHIGIDVVKTYDYNYDAFIYLDRKEYDDDNNGNIDRIDYFTYDAELYLIREERDLDNISPVDTVIDYMNTEGILMKEMWDIDYDGALDYDQAYTYTPYDNAKYYKREFDDYAVGAADSIEDVTYYYYKRYVVELEIDDEVDSDIDERRVYTYDAEWKIIKEEWDDNGNGSIDRVWTRTYDRNDRLLVERHYWGDIQIANVIKKYYWDDWKDYWDE